MSNDITRAMLDAEQAMKRRRNQHEAPRTTARQTEDLLVFNGVPLATKKDVDKVRDDFNEVLGNLEVGGPRETVLTVVEGGVELAKLEGLQHHLFETLAKVALIKDQWGNRKNIMLKGPTGSGKSTAGKQLAELLKVPFNYLGQTLMPHDMMGSVNQVSDKYRSTAFVDIFVGGGVIMLEEMDAWSPNATLVTNVPLANGYITLPNGVTHSRHKDCIIIACTNTWGTGATADYVGRNRLDAAYLDRFGIKMDWGYDEQLERAACGNADVAEAVQLARHNAERAGLKVIISPRSSIEVADMMRHGFTMREAMGMNFLSGLNKSQIKRVMEDI